MCISVDRVDGIELIGIILTNKVIEFEMNSLNQREEHVENHSSTTVLAVLVNHKTNFKVNRQFYLGGSMYRSYWVESGKWNISRDSRNRNVLYACEDSVRCESKFEMSHINAITNYRQLNE